MVMRCTCSPQFTELVVEGPTEAATAIIAVLGCMFGKRPEVPTPPYMFLLLNVSSSMCRRHTAVLQPLMLLKHFGNVIVVSTSSSGDAALLPGGCMTR